MKGVQCYELFGGIARKKSRIYLLKNCWKLLKYCKTVDLQNTKYWWRTPVHVLFIYLFYFFLFVNNVTILGGYVNAIYYVS